MDAMREPGSLAFLALDQGTTSSKALVIDTTGRVLASASRPLAISSPRAGWVEQDPMELWLSVAGSAAEALATARSASPGLELAAIGISNQRESVVAWNDEGPQSAVLSWQDQRGTEACRALAGSADLVARRTGLELTAMYSAMKLKWLVDHVDAPGLKLGTIDAWLVDRLTGGERFVTEVGNAGRTLLLDIERLNWADDMCDLFGVDKRLLPTVVASDGGFGATRGVPGIPDGVPIRAVMGDSHAALYGHWATAPDLPGAAKATYGTGSSVMAPALGPTARRAGVSTTVAWQVAGETLWAHEANILYSGAGLDYLAATLGVAGGRAMSELAATADSSDGCYFVPALNGLGAPWWASEAVGTLTGLNTRVGRAQIARAGLESIAHQVADIIDVMDPARRLEVLHAGGGATSSELLMQTQADLLGRRLVVANVRDVSAVGAAVLAARASGTDISPEPDAVRIVAPVRGDSWRDEQRKGWSAALGRAGVPGRGPTSPTDDFTNPNHTNKE